MPHLALTVQGAAMAVYSCWQANEPRGSGLQWDQAEASAAAADVSLCNLTRAG